MLLGDVADLAGYLIEIPYGEDLLPDVVRLHPHRPSLLVADAKDTETAACEATRRRFARYLRHSRRWTTAGFDVTVAISHGPGSGPWDALILAAARDARSTVALPLTIHLDELTALTWAGVTGD
ncbi:MAG TPA: hypothetical protein VEW93_01820 [Acidimicrobiales bacterium]|nr:hypothetical protein [Acidimicrobiales bacterium]